MTKYIVRDNKGWPINFQSDGYGICDVKYATRFESMTEATVAMIRGNIEWGRVELVSE